MHELERLAEGGSPVSSDHDMSSQYWQACIFKVGDDVRQVGHASLIQDRGFRGRSETGVGGGGGGWPASCYHNVSSQYLNKQACFKACDDVRQVMLQ